MKCYQIYLNGNTFGRGCNDEQIDRVDGKKENFANCCNLSRLSEHVERCVNYGHKMVRNDQKEGQSEAIVNAVYNLASQHVVIL